MQRQGTEKFNGHGEIKNFWIIGCGKFGRLAAARLLNIHPRASFLVVDNREEALRQIWHLPVKAVRGDGVDFLAANLKKEELVYLVPALPVHLAFEWVKKKLAPAYEVIKIPVPEEAVRALPNPLPAETGKLYASYATFTCPDNCPEPEDVCTVTGRKRKGLLFKDFQELYAEGFISLAIRSLQLAPGVGGFPSSVLWTVLEKVRRAGTGVNYLLSTACLCHGVMDSFRLGEP